MKNLEQLHRQDGKMVCLAVLFALSVGSYLVLSRLTARQGKDRGALLRSPEDKDLPLIDRVVRQNVYREIEAHPL